MRITKRQAKATSLDHAIELAKRHAKERRLPSKVMADLMGVELKTYYRWLLENTLPLNRIAQFEALTGSGRWKAGSYRKRWRIWCRWPMPAPTTNAASVYAR